MESNGRNLGNDDNRFERRCRLGKAGTVDNREGQKIDVDVLKKDLKNIWDNEV